MWSGVGNFDHITPIWRRRQFTQRSTVLYAPGEFAIGVVLSGGAPVVVSNFCTQEW
jgi:hypothetical protein